MVDFTNRHGQLVQLKCGQSRCIRINQPDLAEHGRLRQSSPCTCISRFRGSFTTPDIFNPTESESNKAIVSLLEADYIVYGKGQMPKHAPWTQEIDYAQVLSGNTGLPLTWQPYEDNNWLVSFP